MKNIKKLLFPLFLVITCAVVYFWAHSVASLPYLPYNCAVPLGILTPALLILTFITSLAMLKQIESSKPVRRSLLSTLAMLVPVVLTGVYFLSYLSYRHAAVLPVLNLPDWPTGITTLFITALCIIHLTALLIYKLTKEKAGTGHVVPAAAGWIIINCCIFFLTI